MKRCSKCRGEFPLSGFFKNRSHTDGHDNSCRTCKAAANRAYNDSTPRRQLSISLRRALVRRPTEKPASAQDLMDLWDAQAGCCALSGIPMIFRQGKVFANSLSIDRIDQGKGYERGNLRLICHAINCFRGSMDDDAMLDMAKALLNHAGVEGSGCGPVEARTGEMLTHLENLAA